MHNSSTSYYEDLPPLPSYQISPLPPLISFIPDKTLTLLVPVAAYWGLSMIFHWIDIYDYFPQYRLHTPAEVAKRNRVSRWEVVRDVLIQQVVQIMIGTLLGKLDAEDVFGKEDYDVAVWARRIRLSQRVVPRLLSIGGVDAQKLGQNLMQSHPIFAGIVFGGRYPALAVVTSSDGIASKTGSSFAPWEIFVASAVFYYIIPALQYIVGMIIVDTWQYFLHRAMHMNKWLYTSFHSRHHRLYVPYAYGALYNHPFEGFLLDTLGTSIAYLVAGMNTRQGMLFFTGLTFKTVDDHCGYALPWDPLQHLSGNNAGYHDVHHQSWGIKTNFSQPCSTFWDRALGTMWTGGDVSARYERSRIAAQHQVDMDQSKITITHSDASESLTQDPRPYQDELLNSKELLSIPEKYQVPTATVGKAELQAIGSRQQVLDDKEDGGVGVLMDEAREEKEAQSMLKKPTRRRNTSSISGTESFKGLRERVTGSMHGRTGGIIGMSSSR